MKSERARKYGLALPRGITIREHHSAATFQIAFTYRGQECRESLTGIPVNRRGLDHAQLTLLKVREEIARGTFSYVEFFPASPRAQQFRGVGSRITVPELLDRYMEKCGRSFRESTRRSDRSWIESRIKPAFKGVPVVDLDYDLLTRWIADIGTELLLKSVRNCVSILRLALDEAVGLKIIQFNPLTPDRIKIQRLVPRENWKGEYIVDPFSRTEIREILNAAQGQSRYLFQFAFHSGLRTGELMALRWRNVTDTHVRVCNNIVETYEGAPKTGAGFRNVVLLDEAKRALLEQAKVTGNGEHVFVDERLGRPMQRSKQVWDLWNKVMEACNVRYRNPYQTRHTYASMLLTEGANRLWLAEQMGHTGPEMIDRHYGKFIPENVAVEVRELLTRLQAKSILGG